MATLRSRVQRLEKVVQVGACLASVRTHARIGHSAAGAVSPKPTRRSCVSVTVAGLPFAHASSAWTSGTPGCSR